MRKNELDPVEEVLAAKIGGALAHCPLFKTVARVPRQASTARTYLEIYAGLQLDNPTSAFVTEVLADLTLYVFPRHERYLLVLRVDAYDKGRANGRFLYKRYLDNYVELFLGVLAPWFWPGTVLDEVSTDMLDAFLADLEDAKILRTETDPADPLPSAPSTEQPAASGR